jgi:hypothetical protein
LRKEEEIEGKTKVDPKLAQELRSSAEKLVIGNNTRVLSTYLWRDFMPGAAENGSSLICINKMSEVDSMPILNAISLKKQYVISVRKQTLNF